MRFTSSCLLLSSALVLGALSACSGDDDGDSPSGADAGTSDSGTPDSGTPDSGTPDSGPVDAGPTGPCPGGALICESFDNGQNGWKPPDEKKHATIQVDGTKPRNGSGALHIVTEDGIDERNGAGNEAIASYQKSMPDFGNQLFVRAHVYMDTLPKQFGVMGTFFVLFSNHDNAWGGIELQGMQNSGFALDDWSGVPGTGWNFQEEPITAGLQAKQWVCLEWEVRRSSPGSDTGVARVYVNGTQSHEFTNVGMRPFNSFQVGYGFVHPKGQSQSETWIDNVVVSATARIGCQ